MWHKKEREVMGLFKRLRERRQAVRVSDDYKDWPLGNNHRPEGFFSPKRWKERVANRREFRVSVSSNRKFIFIGLAVIAVCGTIIYLSVVYGGAFSWLL